MADRRRLKSRTANRKAHRCRAISRCSTAENVAAKRPFGSHITVKQRRGSLELSSRAGKMPKSGSIERLCSNPILQNKGADSPIAKYQTALLCLSGQSGYRGIENMLCTNAQILDETCNPRLTTCKRVVLAARGACTIWTNRTGQDQPNDLTTCLS